MTITVALATDEPLFNGWVTALKGVSIKKSILAPFDRAIAQEWWEKH